MSICYFDCKILEKSVKVYLPKNRCRKGCLHSNQQPRATLRLQRGLLVPTNYEKDIWEILVGLCAWLGHDEPTPPPPSHSKFQNAPPPLQIKISGHYTRITRQLVYCILCRNCPVIVHIGDRFRKHRMDEIKKKAALPAIARTFYKTKPQPQRNDGNSH